MGLVLPSPALSTLPWGPSIPTAPNPPRLRAGALLVVGQAVGRARGFPQSATESTPRGTRLNLDEFEKIFETTLARQRAQAESKGK